MLLYVDELLREIDSIQKYASIIREKFEQNRESNELLLDAKALHVRVINLDQMMPEGTTTANLLRHTWFMVHWLGKGDLDSCRHDIIDDTESDLSHKRSEVERWSRELIYVDAELRQDVLPLLRTKQFDSAILKAFIILKARLCVKFGIDENIDGPKMINQIFGAQSGFLKDIDAGLKQSLSRFLLRFVWTL